MSDWTMGLPQIEVSAHEIEIRHCSGLWSKWEGRVVYRRRWAMGGEWTTVHVHPAHPNPPNARVFQVGGYPYWMRARSKDRLEWKLRTWIADEIKARQQAQEVEVIEP